MNKTNIGSFIREKRIEQKLSQYDLADKAGVGYRRILEMEKDRKNYSVDVLISVINVLGYDLSFVSRDGKDVKWQQKDDIYSTNIFNFNKVLAAKPGDTNSKNF
jgi:transcriptional regulator with XRE-family HTH domain